MNKYLYMDLYATHWRDISLMLEDNYAKDIDANIIVGSCTLYSVEHFRKVGVVNRDKVIVYQLEPLIEGHWHKREKIINNLKGADEVWDYDLDNIEILKQYGIDAKYRPCLYSESLKRIENSPEPDIDILFYGTPSPRRTKFIYDSLYGSVIPEKWINTITGCRTVILHHFWGKELDHFISRSKIVVNLSPYDNTSVQQQTRIFYLLTNNKCVISEKSNKNYFGGLIQEFSTPQEMFYTVAELLDGDKWKEYTHNNFAGYSMTVRNLLKDK